MSKSEQVVLADGLTAVIPEGWEYCCESDGDFVVHSIGMLSTTCDANLELLNNFGINPKDFISTYSFKLMNELIDLGLSFQNHDPKYSDELVAIEEKTNSVVYHAFLSTSPVAHISAVCRDIEDLRDLRQIKDSIRIDQAQFNASPEDLIEMKLSNFWRPEIESSGADDKVPS